MSFTSDKQRKKVMAELRKNISGVPHLDKGSGWHGESRRHSEAARKGQRNKRNRFTVPLVSDMQEYTAKILKRNMPSVESAIDESKRRLQLAGEALIRERIADGAVSLLIIKGIITVSKSVYAKSIILALI